MRSGTITKCAFFLFLDMFCGSLLLCRSFLCMTEVEAHTAHFQMAKHATKIYTTGYALSIRRSSRVPTLRCHEVLVTWEWRVTSVMNGVCVINNCLAFLFFSGKHRYFDSKPQRNYWFPARFYTGTALRAGDSLSSVRTFWGWSPDAGVTVRVHQFFSGHFLHLRTCITHPKKPDL